MKGTTMENPNPSHAALVAEIARLRQEQREAGPVMELDDVVKRQSNAISMALAYIKSGRPDAAQVILEAEVQ